MTVELEERLRSLADVLDVADSIDGDRLFARIDERPGRSASGAVLRVAAALILMLAALVVAVPSSRGAVADWFGFDGARIERRPVTSVPAEPDPIEGRGVGTVVRVGSTDVDSTDDDGTIADSTEVHVSAFTGTLDNPALAKIATAENRVLQVAVNGQFALWIDGEPHQVSFFDERGEIVFEGFAGNTLLWQDGPLIRRLEGFGDVTTAIDYAESIGT